MTSHPSINASADDWLVYADQLQSKGDARGELIVLNHAVASGGPAESRDAFVRAHAEELLGPAGRHVGLLRLRWRWMWIDSAEVIARSSSDATAIVALLDSPAAAEMTALTIAGDAASEGDKIDLGAGVAHIAKRGLPASVKSLSLIDARAARSTSVIATFYDPPPNIVDFGSLGALWPKLSSLERLHLSVSDALQIELGAIDAPALRSFRVDCLTWGGGEQLPHALDEASWPNLEELELRLPEAWTFSVPDDELGYTRPYAEREDEYYEDEDDGYHEDVDWAERLRPLLTSLRRTKLRRLALHSFDSAGSVLDAIQDAGLPETLQELDLSESNIGDEAVMRLVELRDVARLKRVVLSKTPAGAESVGRLREKGVEVAHSEGPGVTHRFLVGME